MGCARTGGKAVALRRDATRMSRVGLHSPGSRLISTGRPRAARTPRVAPSAAGVWSLRGRRSDCSEFTMSDGRWQRCSGTGSRRVAASVSTALGRTTTHQVQHLSRGAERRAVTEPTGLQTVTQTRTDGTRTSTAPDGTVTNPTQGPDPRFEMEACLTVTVCLLPLALRSRPLLAASRRAASNTQRAV
jgi:hypothetical protein